MLIRSFNFKFLLFSNLGHSFRELYTFVDRNTPLLPKRPSNPNTAFIVSAFKALGSLDNLDKTWSYWSGADYIVECIPKMLKLERVTFHKVTDSVNYTSSKDSFAYVLLCEIGEALSDMNRTREFVDTLKYRQCGVTSLYIIDHFF